MHEQVTGAKLPPVGALAYLGDGVHSLYIRKMLVKSGISRPGDLSRTALAYITAERQADAFRRIENHLLPDELDVARRA